MVSSGLAKGADLAARTTHGGDLACLLCVIIAGKLCMKTMDEMGYDR